MSRWVVHFLVFFMSFFFVQSKIFTFHQYAKLILDTRQCTKSASVFLMFPRIYGESQLERMASIQALVKLLTTEGVKISCLTFSQYQMSVSLNRRRIRKPLYVAFFTTLDSIEKFKIVSETNMIDFPNWLMIFVKFPEKILEMYCSKPEGNPFHLGYATEVIVLCNNILKRQKWQMGLENGTKVITIGFWSPGNQTTPFTPKHFQTRSNFLDGKKLNIMTLEHSSFVYEVDGKFRGYFGLILNELIKAINFTVSHIIKSTLPNVDDSINATFSTKESAILDSVESPETDIGIGGIGMTVQRMDRLDFTLPISISPDHLYFREPEESGILWTAYFQGFEFTIWAVIIATTCIITFSIALIKHKYENEKISIRSIFDIYIGVLGIFCQQGSGECSSASSMKLVYFAAFATSLIVYAIYSAFLISYITLSVVSLPFTDLDSFTKEGSYQLIVVNNSAAYEFFAFYQKDGIIREMNKMMKKPLPQSDIDAFEQVCREKVAFYVSEVVYASRKSSIPCKLMWIKTGIDENYALILTKDSAYTEILNYHILKLSTTGVLSHLKHQEKISSTTAMSQTIVNPVAFTGIAPVLTIVAAGIVFAFFILCIERLYHWFRNRKTFIVI